LARPGAMTWIGIDDTDSPSGGCTTFVLTEVLRAAAGVGVDLIGEPRLVRLNPNIPFKTRGNAALAARFGHGRGAAKSLGELPDGALRSFPRGDPLRAIETERLVDAAWTAVRAEARLGEARTDPALVAAPRRLPAELYWNAVRRLVSVEEVERHLRGAGATLRVEDSRQGVVGAAAAIAWSGGHPTWELIAYRSPDRYSEHRRVGRDSVLEAERRFPELFLCTDRRTRRVLIAPHTPCPILFGLRATRPQRLPEALRQIRSEPWERWVVFRTNQGTGDHLAQMGISELTPFSSAVLTGVVGGPPVIGPGGHGSFPLTDRSGASVVCVAFEPTKTLPRIVAGLREGDRLRVWGGTGANPTFRLEGIEVLHTRPRSRRAANPRCPSCGRRMHSLGRARGFRCPVDRVRLPPEGRGVRPGAAPPLRGRYHPTPSARRHLHPRAPEGERGSETPVRWWRRFPRANL
jgi:tRNA(Ile2)-agmatinylcytidine synthase